MCIQLYACKILKKQVSIYWEIWSFKFQNFFLNRNPIHHSGVTVAVHIDDFVIHIFAYLLPSCLSRLWRRRKVTWKRPMLWSITRSRRVSRKFISEQRTYNGLHASVVCIWFQNRRNFHTLYHYRLHYHQFIWLQSCCCGQTPKAVELDVNLFKEWGRPNRLDWPDGTPPDFDYSIGNI